MKQKKSGPAIFMYSVIAFMVAVSAVSFTVYYSAVKIWCGIVSFMIVYHFWLRLIMGNVTKLFKNN